MYRKTTFVSALAALEKAPISKFQNIHVLDDKKHELFKVAKQ